MHRRSQSVASAACALALACRGVTDPPLPGGAERFTPPPVYARWWALVEACSGVAGPLGAVQFYRVPGAANVGRDADGSLLGYWSAPGNQIVLAGDWADHGGTVRHEMLHALVRGHGHPAAYFQGRCRGVVSCTDACEAEGPPPAGPPADAPTLPLSALDLRVEVLPGRPLSRTAPDRALTLVVRVTNPTAGPVWVPLDPSPDLSAPFVYWYGFRIVPAGAPVPVTDYARSDEHGGVTSDRGPRLGFRAGETRQLVFDVSAAWYPAGDYLAVGIFNARQVWVPLTVTP